MKKNYLYFLKNSWAVSLLLIFSYQATQAQSDTLSQLYVQTGHQQAITCIAVSPDKAHFATGSIDNDLRIWDLDKKLEKLILKGHQGDVECLAFSPDSKYLVSAATDGQVILWEVKTGEQINTLKGHEGTVKALVFNPQNALLYSAGADKVIRVWEIPSGKLIKTFGEQAQSIYALAVDKQGLHLLSAGLEPTIKQWNLETYTLARNVGTCSYPIFDLEFSPDDSLVLSAGGSKFEDKGELKLWDFRQATLKANFEGHQTEIRQACFSPDGQNILSGGGNELLRELKFWNVQNEALVRNLQGHQYRIRAATFGADTGEVISAGGEYTGNQSELFCWDSATGTLTKKLKGSTSPLTTLASSQDEQTLASGFESGTIRIWQLDNAQRTFSLQQHTKRISALAFSPTQQLLASSSEDKSTILWPLGKDSIQYRPLKVFTSNYFQRCLAFSPDGKYLAMAGINDIFLLNMQTLAVEDTLSNAHDLMVFGLEFSPDGKNLLSAGYDKTLKLWDVSTKKLLKSVVQPSQVLAIDWSSTSGQWLSLGYDAKLRTWTSAGKLLTTTDVMLQNPTQALFLKGNNQMALIGNTGKIQLFNDKITSLDVRQSTQQTMVFLPQKNYLISGGTDGVATLWDMNKHEVKFYFIHFDGLEDEYLILSADQSYTLKGNKKEEVYFISQGVLQPLAPQLETSNVLEK